MMHDSTMVKQFLEKLLYSAEVVDRSFFFNFFKKNEVNTVVIQMTFIDDFTSFEVANRNSYYEEIIKKLLSRLFLTKVAFPNNEN